MILLFTNKINKNWENGINKEMAAKINAFELRKKYKIAEVTLQLQPN